LTPIWDFIAGEEKCSSIWFFKVKEGIVVQAAEVVYRLYFVSRIAAALSSVVRG
jgi:hypothetical protein